MKPTSAILLVLALGASALLGWVAAPALGGGKPEPGPLAPAADGQVECYSPDAADQTCRAMVSYSRNFDGSYDSRAIMKIPYSEPSTIEMTSRVQVVSGAVCGKLLPEDLAAAKLVVGGRELPAQAAEAALATIAKGMGAFVGREVCTHYRADGARLTATHTIDGSPDPLGREEQVLWVDPKGGFRLAS